MPKREAPKPPSRFHDDVPIVVGLPLQMKRCPGGHPTLPGATRCPVCSRVLA
jgi:hypothetical protein